MDLSITTKLCVSQAETPSCASGKEGPAGLVSKSNDGDGREAGTPNRQVNVEKSCHPIVAAQRQNSTRSGISTSLPKRRHRRQGEVLPAQRLTASAGTSILKPHIIGNMGASPQPIEEIGWAVEALASGAMLWRHPPRQDMSQPSGVRGLGPESWRASSPRCRPAFRTLEKPKSGGGP